MKVAQQLTNIRDLKLPIVKLKLKLSEVTTINITKSKIQLGTNYIIKQGDSLLDSFSLNNPSQLETVAVYMTLQEFLMDNYKHIRKELIIDNNFRLYSLNFATEGLLLTTTVKKSSPPYHLFTKAPYYLEEVIANSNNCKYGIIAYISEIYFHIGWTDTELHKTIRL